MSQYSTKVIDAAGKSFSRSVGGIKKLTEFVVYNIPRNAKGNLLEAGARAAANYPVGVIGGARERADWLDRHGVKYGRRDPYNVYADIFAKGGAYLVYQYLKKHGYALYHDTKDRATPYKVMDTKTGKLVRL